MNKYKYSRKELSELLLKNRYKTHADFIQTFVAHLLAIKKVKKDHGMTCATNASEVCDEFAVMGCTCGFKAPKKTMIEPIREVDGEWYTSKVRAKNYSEREELLRNEHNKLVALLNSEK